jgi:hypothetical protein
MESGIVEREGAWRGMALVACGFALRTDDDEKKKMLEKKAVRGSELRRPQIRSSVRGGGFGRYIWFRGHLH